MQGLDDIEEKLLGGVDAHPAALVYKAVISMLRLTANDGVTMVTQQVQAVLNALFFQYGKTRPPTASVRHLLAFSTPVSWVFPLLLTS